MAAPKRNRFFQTGEKVVVRKKTHLLDQEREHEGIPKGVHREAIDEKVTGIEGVIEGGAYQSPSKGDAWYQPIRVGNGGVISVPQERLERENNTPRLERRQDDPNSPAVSKETISFWRKYFRREEELKRLKKKGRA